MVVQSDEYNGYKPLERADARRWVLRWYKRNRDNLALLPDNFPRRLTVEALKAYKMQQLRTDELEMNRKWEARPVTTTDTIRDAYRRRFPDRGDGTREEMIVALNQSQGVAGKSADPSTLGLPATGVDPSGELVAAARRSPIWRPVDRRRDCVACAIFGHSCTRLPVQRALALRRQRRCRDEPSEVDTRRKRDPP